MKSVNIETINFKNDLLKNAVKLAMEKDFKVFIFQEKNISQVFLENKKGQICTISERNCMLDISNVHKPCKKCGTSHQLFSEIDIPTVKMFNTACETIAPAWDIKNSRFVIKYKNMEEMNREKYLTYKRLI